MSKAGKKLLAAAREALKAVRCDHEWERVSMLVVDGKIVSQTDDCPKCGARKTTRDMDSAGVQWR